MCYYPSQQVLLMLCDVSSFHGFLQAIVKGADLVERREDVKKLCEATAVLWDDSGYKEKESRKLDG